MFANKPNNISTVNLKVSISEEIRASPRSVCRSVMVNFAMTMSMCLKKMYGFKWWSFGASPINPNRIIESFLDFSMLFIIV